MEASFRPMALAGNAHVQTLLGRLGFDAPALGEAVQHVITLDDGDRIVLHENTPVPAAVNKRHEGTEARRHEGEEQIPRSARNERDKIGASKTHPTQARTEPERVVVLVHGLAGDHASTYMRRVAGKLLAAGVRVFRLDLRTCGAGIGLARRPYHSGRSEDIEAALRAVERLCPGARVGLVGFSLGGNIVLKLLGEAVAALGGRVERAAVVCPPVDLLESVRHLARRPTYDRYFARRLVRGAAENRRRLAEAADVTPAARARSVYEFDQRFTAPVCGFGTAERYYAACSAGPLMARIEVPTLVVASRDDPLVPWGPLGAARRSSAVRVVAPERGGHMGFFGARNGDGDRRWAEWRVVEWILGEGR